MPINIKNRIPVFAFSIFVLVFAKAMSDSNITPIPMIIIATMLVIASQMRAVQTILGPAKLTQALCVVVAGALLYLSIAWLPEKYSQICWPQLKYIGEAGLCDATLRLMIENGESVELGQNCMALPVRQPSGTWIVVVKDGWRIHVNSCGFPTN
ncbi:MAG: hypothetical protein ACKVP7_16165 [Hyphomicrobiaceae bacterium]